MSSAIRICLLFAATLSLHIGLTPPTRPPPTKDQFIPNQGSARASEIMLRWLLSTPTSYYKMFLWITATSETLVILSLNHPASPVSDLIKSFLIFPGHTGKTIADAPSPLFVVSSLLVVLGGIIRVNCFRTLGKSFTFELSFREGQKLITSGLYSVVRHPSYTGAVISLGPTIVMHMCSGSWIRESGVLDTYWGKSIAFVWFGGMALMMYTVVMRISSEEKILSREFGDEWLKWKKEVPYKLCPGVY